MTRALKLIDRDDAYVTAPYLAETAGITYRQMDYWTRTGLLESLAVDRKGSGHPRIYSPEQVRRARVIARLVEAGVNLQWIRSHLEVLLNVGVVQIGAVTIQINEEEL